MVQEPSEIIAVLICKGATETLSAYNISASRFVHNVIRLFRS